MKYITKIDNTHIVELNGRNVKVEDYSKKDLHVYILEDKGYIRVVKEDFKMSTFSSGATLDQYVVAYELVKLVLGK